MALARIGENAANVVSAVKDKVEIVNDAMPEGVVLRPVYDRTDLVDKAVNTAVKALVEGSILVAIVLFLFLGELRSALVVITAPPGTVPGAWSRAGRKRAGHRRNGH